MCGYRSLFIAFYYDLRKRKQRSRRLCLNRFRDWSIQVIDKTGKDSSRDALTEAISRRGSQVSCEGED